MNFMVTAFLVLVLAAVYVLAAPTTNQEIDGNDLFAKLEQSIQDMQEDLHKLKELYIDANITEENPTLAEEDKTNSGENKNVDQELPSPDNGILTGGRGRAWGGGGSGHTFSRSGGSTD